MVAARSRLLPVGLMIMLFLAGVPALAPTATAAAGTGSIDRIQVHVAGSEATDSFNPLAKIGTPVTIRVHGNVTVGSNDCDNDAIGTGRSHPVLSVTAEFQTLGGSSGTPLDVFFPGNSTPETGTRRYPFLAVGTFETRQPATGASLNAEVPVGLATDLRWTCVEITNVNGPSAGGPVARTSTAKILVDNTPPSVVATLEPKNGPTAGIGSRVMLNITSPNDIASGVYDATQVDPTSGHAGTPGKESFSGNPGPREYDLRDTGIEIPSVWLNLTDANGNTANVQVQASRVDAQRPPAPVVVTAALPGPSIRFGATNVPGEIAGYAVNLTRIDGTIATLVCPGINCVVDTLPNFVITGHGLVSNRSHTLSVAARDEGGNQGPWTHGISVTTIQEPRGLLTLSFDSGVGGIGTILNYTWNATGARDVATVTFTSPNLTASPVTITNDSSRPWFTYVVERTDKEGAWIDVTLTSQSGATFTFPAAWHPSRVGANFTVFDTRPPFAIPGSLAARARTGGLVELDVPAPDTGDIGAFRINATCKGSATNTCSSTTQRSVVVPVPAGFVQGSTVTLNIGGDNFSADFDKVWEITAAPLDKHNNIGPTSAAVQTFPGNNPLVLLVGNPARAVVSSIAVPLVPIVGTYSSSVDIVSLNYSLRNETHWWNGGNALQPASWSTERGADKYFDGNRTGSLVTGTWRANLSCVDGNNPCGTALQNATLPSGKYTIVVTMKNIETTVLEATKEIWLDKAAPTRNKAVITTPSGFQQGTGPVRLDVNYTDEGPSGLTSLSFQLINASDNGVAYDVNNTAVPPVVCPSAACVSGPVAGSVFDGTVEFGLPLVHLKDYKLRVTASDAAGNAATAFTTEQIIRLQPRVAISGDDHGPFATASGLTAFLYAAYDGLTTVQPAGSCTSEFTCRVTQVDLYGRNRTQSGDGFLLASYHIPLPSPPATVGGTAKYYNYSPTGVLTDLKGLNREDMYVRGVARVSVQGTATQVVNMTPWLRVGTDALPSGLAVHTPANATTVFMSGAAGTVNLNVTYDRVAVETTPLINYTVQVLHDRADATRVGKYVRVDTTSSTTCGVQATPPSVTMSGRKIGESLHDFNFTNACRLPAGEYLLNATLRESASGPAILSTTRPFAVESAAPAITTVAEGSEIYREGYTRQQFKLQLRVDHGYANLSADGLVLTLDTFGASGFSTLHKGGPEGFDYAIHDVTQTNGNQSSTANLTVTLPSSAAHDSRYDLRVNATTQSFWTNGTVTGIVPSKATRVSSIIVDARAPSASTTASASNATGSLRTSELRISGTAQDSGAGIAAVEVRIINLNLSQTFVFDGGASGSWAAGVLDSSNAWLTSDLVRPSTASTDYARNVHIVPASATLVGWVVNDTNRVRHLESGAVNATSLFSPIGLDRNYTYQVDVRARDLLGNMGNPQTSFVSFDVNAPIVGAPTPTGAAADKFVDWHGAGGITVSVDEDNCVKRVSLVGVRPDGTNATPVAFPRPAGATCTATGGAGAHTWSLDLAQNPDVTHLVGTYDYRVEVEDAAGKIRRSTQNITLTVNDTVQAKVRFLYLEPPTVGANTRSRIVAEIEEFGEIDRVIAVFERLEGTTASLIAQGEMTRLPPAVNRTSGNGTHWFVAETDTHLNVTELPVGHYLWTIRPVDVALGCTPNGCDQETALVRVTAEAAPVIQLDSPSANAEWVNRTPTFQWRVFNYNAGENGLTLLVGNSSENLTETNVTSVTPISTTTGNVTGAVVTYSPTLADDGNFSVRLEATSTTGFSNRTNVLTFRTDITPPNVSANVTGTRDYNNVTYGVAATRIALAANDTLSGVAGITYRIGDGSPRAYTAPIAITGDDGDWTLSWTATDVAGNKAGDSLTLKVDSTGPEIRVAEPGDDMLLVVEDKGVGAVGVDETTVVVYYAYGAEPVFSQMEATRETTNSYRVNLGGNASAVGLRYYVVARDNFNNLGTLGSEADPEEIEKDDQLPPPPPPPENTPPVVVIVKPVAGAQVRGEVIFQWEATDADGDALEVNLALQVPNGPSETLRNGAEASGTLTFDLSRKAAGPYTFVVVASDSEESTTAQVTFSVLVPQDVTVITPPPVNAVGGDAIPLAVRVNSDASPVANVTYVITRDGETYETGPMAKQGDMYTATFVVPDEAGEYESAVQVAYSDGTPSKSFPMGATTVAASTGVGPGPSGGVSIGFIVLLVLGVLTIGLSAGGAFWRWRK